MSSIQHTVVFRLVHAAGSAAEAAFLETARRTLPAIPGVGDFTVNRQVGGKSDLTWQFSMVFVDDAAYAAYESTPRTPGSSSPAGCPRWPRSRSTTSSRLLRAE